MQHIIPSERVIERKRYVASRDTKNYTVYVNEERPEDKLNQKYLPKGLPQTLEIWVVIPEATEAKAKE